MAERCNRCVGDHRHIRRELLKWHKNVAQLCGMERVAQELMGSKKWRKLMTPFNGLEQIDPQDWSPYETCCLCETKLQSQYESTDSVVPPCDQSLDDQTSDDTKHGDKCSQCAGLSTPNSKCLCKSSHSSHPIDQPLDLSIHSRHKGSTNGDLNSKKATHKRDINNSIIKVPKPLTNTTTTTINTNTKAIKRNRLTTNTTWKRTYSEEELEAALNDIQSGKLGTRRAAVIYGIPRSTLRNKVYKLALEKSNNGKRKVSPTSTTTTTIKSNNTSNSVNKKLSKSLLINNNKSNNNNSNKSANHMNSTLNHSVDEIDNSAMSASESLKQILKNAITQRANTNDIINKNKTNDINSGGIGQALNNYIPGVGFNSLTDLYNCEALATIQMLSTLECGQALAPLFTQFLLNIHQLALANRQSGTNSDDINSLFNPNIPLLPELIQKLAEDQIVQTARTNSSQTLNLLNGDKSELQDKQQEEISGTGNNNVILKVPSYKPKSTTSAAVTGTEVKQSNEEQPNNGNSSDTEVVNALNTSSSHTESDERINDEFESKSISMKDIIAKSISQRLYNSTTNAKFSTFANSEDSSSDALVSDDKSDKFETFMPSDLKNSGNISDHSNPSTPEKRNRPKRGRYRNYNRDDLAKAVKAVQRGEMSVHRAGTLFGVPHSTLEYKVKERHLLRPKKRLNDSNANIKKDGINKTNGNINNRLINGSTSVPTNNSTNLSVNRPLWQSAFPLLPVEMNTSTQNSANFFASNMIRKLQENARLNEEMVKTVSETNSDLSGGLINSLIKSSLVNKALAKQKLNDNNDDNNNNEEDEEEENDDEEEEEDDNNSNNNNDNEVVNTSLELLKEVSALKKQD
ncbi:mushroom body large-type Kenyon cell-specific protein 1-like [Oppia nitens]|uniref:mushroom body large-type Kenyon cell-specific protein 1-like n=1 Tax=Oppia nitens TaxID=1686743 RepID=UPI0023DCB161|nr:mushroom body large-type Kenyon cell-specific protein 1-like [Oppia nitens]